jgi:protein SCO1
MSAVAAGQRPSFAASRAWRSVAIALSIAALIAGAVAMRVTRTVPPPAALPVLGHIPSFRLVDQRNDVFTTESMLGHVSVVDFIFTRCPSSCPRLTARMGELQRRIERDHEDVRLVSFSVDPENDTAPVLGEYAAKAGADPARWTFLTGSVDEIARAVVLGFKVSAAKIARGANDYDVTHGEWFVLVDRSGDVRGFYPTSQPEEFEALVDAVVRLAGSGRRL